MHHFFTFLACALADPRWKPGCDEHTVFMVGEPLLIAKESEEGAVGDGRIAVVLSSRNLLMNGWRAMQSREPLQIFMDTTYRLTVEGFGVFTVGVMDPSQRYHVVAHALVSSEDTDGLVHCLQQVRAGVSETITEYIRCNFSA